MSAPLYEKLMQYKNENFYPFHMPGHKQGRGLCAPEELMKMDITEIDGFDNLHHPETVIKQAQDLCAKTFGADGSFFLVNGSSCGLEAAILSVLGDGQKALVARNCHRSVYSGLILSGAKPIYVIPESMDVGLCGGVTASSVEQKLNENPDIRVIILTSPTYEGFCSDIKKIAELAHERQIPLIVDEAHGAHMGFHKNFPSTALEQGADIVVQSVHKTLSSPTQTALLHYQGALVNPDQLRETLALVETTSPSYLLMGAIDQCREELDQHGVELFKAYWNRLEESRQVLEQNKRIRLLGKELLKKFGIYDIDLGKLVFFVDVDGISGKDVMECLIHRYGIQMEMAGPHHLVAMTSMADDDQGFLKLCKAMKELDQGLWDKKGLHDLFLYEIELPKQCLIPRQGVFYPRQAVPLEQSIGMISAEFVIPYPPGIPILVPGEEINKRVLDQFRQFQSTGISVTGVKDMKYHTIQVIKET